jgi:hypothetical protein
MTFRRDVELDPGQVRDVRGSRRVRGGGIALGGGLGTIIIIALMLLSGGNLGDILGGEEFVAILDGSDRDAAVKVADEVRSTLAGRTVVAEDGQELSVTVSAGCAELDPADPTRESLLRTADVALFMAKRGGRDRVVAA